MQGKGGDKGKGNEKETEELGGLGLENMGNTCYMSAFLQVLVRAHSFTQRLFNLPPSTNSVALGDGDATEVVLQHLHRMMSILLLSELRISSHLFGGTRGPCSSSKTATSMTRTRQTDTSSPEKRC